MFDVGQHVVCVRKTPWPYPYPNPPTFLQECIVAAFWRKGEPFTCARTGKVLRITEDAIDLDGYPECVFPAKDFRPKEPNIEALRDLLTDVPIPDQLTKLAPNRHEAFEFEGRK